MAKETGSNSHIATQRGYAAGQLIEEGEFVPAGVTVSDEWMDAVSAKEAKRHKAALETSDATPGDVDLTQLTVSALQAMAAERGANVKGLSKDDLIAAIKAEKDPAKG